jgi:hypothetical protein
MSRNPARAIRKSGATLPVLVVAALVAGARSAAACSVCFSASEEARAAYYGTTALLILLPLLMVGGLVYWLHRVARAQQSAAAGADPSTAPVRIIRDPSSRERGECCRFAGLGLEPSEGVLGSPSRRAEGEAREDAVLSALAAEGFTNNPD